jgi:hypothetical protein
MIFATRLLVREYYNYMRGIWKDGSLMCYGGNGHQNGGCNPAIQADFMFPGDSDEEWNWGTNGTPMPSWTEETAGNPPGDRRFMQSAGPFTLTPGEYNNITVGVVWARSFQGGPFESVKALFTADDKAHVIIRKLL